MAKQDGTREARRAGTVQSVERALAILEVLGEDEDGLRLTDLATRTGLSASTVHRLLTTLELRRFVQFDPTGGMWHVGRAAFTVGSAFARQRNFVAPALPVLRRLRDQTRETANLGVIDEGEVVVLTQVESREIMRAITRVGGRAPIISSGMGKAILASYPEPDIDAVIKRFGMRKSTARTITDRKRLEADLSATRARGYAIDDEEYVLGLRCVAATVYDANAEALCAISISGLSARVTDDRLEALGRLVAGAARELTGLLGGSAPSR
ncbi:IclR family transcriptional regulator [Pelagibacterium xiamenense]|uniref:IclR family transcriptional regulator n=1 Tax=Pelagibacterium xiamenense TaxID=2901140 RepID=UPI001E636DAC|nr:IclR family transcriptional regulator C-terminal domain-containing protein [Pelagibacterium xiamenense]MCD7059644.1 helix-turn-helix domain-containing protein [Pelagibacterium xiamenense]